MDQLSSLGKMIMILGVVLLGVGFIITFVGKVLPFGRLPGDILIRKGNFTFYFPLVTSIVVSVILTILLNFFGRK